MPGVRVHDPEPRHVRRRLRDAFEQIRQSVAQSHVAPVIGAVLRHQHDLLHALVGQPPRLRDDLVCRRAVQLALHLRDDAKGAWGVAAVSDLEVRTRAAEHRRLGDIVRLHVEVQRHDRAREGADATPVLGAEHGIDLGHLGFQLGAVQRRQAAGDNQLLASAFPGRQLEYRVHRFFLRGIDEAAGVDDDHVRTSRGADLDVRALAEHTADALAVRDVLRATESDDVIPHESAYRIEDDRRGVTSREAPPG